MQKRKRGRPRLLDEEKRLTGKLGDPRLDWDARKAKPSGVKPVPWTNPPVYPKVPPPAINKEIDDNWFNLSVGQGL